MPLPGDRRRARFDATRGDATRGKRSIAVRNSSRCHPVQYCLHLAILRIAVLASREARVKILGQSACHLSCPSRSELRMLREQTGYRRGDVLPPAFGVTLPGRAHLVFRGGLVGLDLVTVMERPG